MKEYHKIDSVYKRDERGKFLLGEFSRPEFEYLKDLPWLWTEKIDGTNIRVMWKPDAAFPDEPYISFGGKTENAQIPTKLYSHLATTFAPLMNQLIDTFGETEVCLYGEGYGAGIQKGGGNYSPDQKFILFDVKIGDWWLTRENVEDIGRKLNIPVVQLGPRYTLSEMIEYVEQTARLLEGAPFSNIGTAKIEGWVGTPAIPLFARNGDRIITKVKYRDFK